MDTPRHVLVTGSSTGIGRACVLHLASRGWRVFAGVRREQDGRTLVAEAARSGGHITPLNLDVTDAASIAVAAATVADRCGAGGLAGLVNNAGISVNGPVELLTTEDWRKQFEVNLFGQIAVTRAVLPALRAFAAGAPGKRPARIVMISSIAARIGQPIVGPYCASKSALDAVAEALRVELADQRIGVSIVQPGPVKSDIWRKGLDEVAATDWSDPGITRYELLIRGVAEVVKRSEQTAIPALRAAAVVERCLTSRRPPVCVLVGRDAKAGAIMKALLPSRWVDGLMLWAVKGAGKKAAASAGPSNPSRR